ncbi:MAG: DUF692 domain-containing protein [Sphingomicrobium sp.]
MRSPVDRLPQRGGIGLKPAHYADLLAAHDRGTAPAWVEVHPQNYFGAGGPPHRWLTAVAERLPLSFHSVGLSLGSPSGLDRDELDTLAALAERYQPAMVSDHLSWSGVDGEKFPDLLPLPMTGASLSHFAREVDRVQNRLGRRILIENPSRVLAFRGDDFDEPGFLGELAQRSGCGLLLDINNILVGAINLGFDAQAYVDAIDPALVGEVHVAGHAIEDHADGSRIAIDDHGSPVSEECWALLERFLERSGPRPVLVERDNEIPPFAELAAEAKRADDLLIGGMRDAA